MTIRATGREEPLQLAQTDDPCSRHAVSSADELPADVVLGLLQGLPTWSEWEGTLPGRRRRGAARVLEWLESWPGAGWQARWTAAAGDHDPGWMAQLAA